MRNGINVVASALALSAFATIFVFHPFTPNLPNPGLDASWMAVLGEAADRTTRFGIDTAFTYGPASPLATLYYNQAYIGRTLPLTIGFALLFGWCAALLIAGSRPGRSARSAAATMAGTVCCGLITISASHTTDPVMLTLPFLVFVLALNREQGTPVIAFAAAAGSVALGVTAMIKMSFPLAALPLLAMADAAALLRRRWPWLLPLFGSGIVSGALLHGQSLADLPAYAVMQGEVVAGYGAAMALDGPVWDITAFVILCVALLVATAAAVRLHNGRRIESWLMPLGLGFTLMILLKAGFIRHDLHSLTAWTGLGILGIVLAACWLPRRTAIAAVGMAVFIALVYEPGVFVRQSTRTGRPEALMSLFQDLLVAGPSREIAAARRWLQDPAAFRAALDAGKVAAWAAIAGAAPLGSLPGTVDIIPSEQSRVLAAGLDYHPRPSFQEYSSYTARLEGDNAAFLRDPNGPRWMLFGPESAAGQMSIDNRFPNLAEGALWPDLLRLYRPDHRIGPLVALLRRDRPLPMSLGPALTLTPTFGTFVPVPSVQPIWATIDVNLTPLGRLAALVFRPPLVTLAVKLDDGRERRFRYLPALGKIGFVLSPLVDNASDFTVLASGRSAGAPRRVTSFAIETSRAAAFLYATTVTATLQNMDVSALVTEASRERPATTAWEALARANPAVAADRIAAPGAGLLTLPLPDLPIIGGHRRIVLGYGLGGGGPEASACFAIRPADGTGDMLWRDCREIRSPTQLGEPHEVTLAVPDGVEELVLEVKCPSGGGGCGGGTAYWAKPTANPVDGD